LADEEERKRDGNTEVTEIGTQRSQRKEKREREERKRREKEKREREERKRREKEKREREEGRRCPTVRAHPSLKNAKDGAPSSTSLGGVSRQTQDLGTQSVPGATGSKSEIRRTKFEKQRRSQDASMVPRSLHCAARRAKERRGRKSRAAPVGMTNQGGVRECAERGID